VNIYVNQIFLDCLAI